MSYPELMKLLAFHKLFISLGLTLLSANVALATTRIENVQPPGVYPHNTYTASYVWTQTTVNEQTHKRESHTQCRIVSSDGKGHLAIESPVKSYSKTTVNQNNSANYTWWHSILAR